MPRQTFENSNIIWTIYSAIFRRRVVSKSYKIGIFCVSTRACIFHLFVILFNITLEPLAQESQNSEFRYINPFCQCLCDSEGRGVVQKCCQALFLKLIYVMVLLYYFTARSCNQYIYIVQIGEPERGAKWRSLEKDTVTI